MIDRLFGVEMRVLEYCSAVWCSAEATQLKVLDRVVSGVRFITGVYVSVTLIIVDLWQYCVYYIRSDVIRCTLFMVLSLVMVLYPLDGAPVWVTRGALVAHRYTYAPTCCRTSPTSHIY